MKKNLRYLLPLVFILTMFSSCLPEDDSFNSAFLIGKWRSGTLYYKYAADLSGSTWDTSDDISESEAQKFTWMLLDSELTHIHIMEMGATVPKVYTVIELTALSLKYEDNFGKQFSFKKVL
jgi:hypothetical protein